MMRALVTGAFGFAGTHLVRHLVDEGDTVAGTFIDAERERAESAPSGLVERFRLDITQGAECHDVITAFKPHVVYHLAGMAFAPDCERDSHRALAVNVGGYLNLLHACHSLKQPVRVLLVSSAEVYGPSTPLPFMEDPDPAPVNDYGLSKLLAERCGARFRHDSLVTPVIARAFNHLGPGQREDFVGPAFALQLARIKREKAAPVLRVGNLSPRRDFSDVRDIVRGYRLVATKGTGTYNLCSGISRSVQELLDSLVTIAGVTVQIETDPTRFRPNKVDEILGSNARAVSELGWNPQTIPFTQTLKDVYEDCVARVTSA